MEQNGKSKRNNIITKLNHRCLNRKEMSFTHYLATPLKFVACWEWYENQSKIYQNLINNVYLAAVLFVIANLTISLMVHIYTEWKDVMSSLELIADGLPLMTSLLIVAYFATNAQELYDLVGYMNNNFKWRSARGLTNMTMFNSYKAAKNFAYFYTTSTFFSVTMYVLSPLVVHWWTRHPLQSWIYVDVAQTPAIMLAFLRQCLAQAFVALSLGQLSVLFATSSILLCGQLDLLCCSLRNVRYTALLLHGVEHHRLVDRYAAIQDDELHSYMYNDAELKDTSYHYDSPVRNVNNVFKFDIYDPKHDVATCEAISECSRLLQVVVEYKERFEKFMSTLLVLRVVQVTLYLCTLLYAATLKFNMVTVEYLAAVAMDIFVYCYFGNQIILQADRVSVAAYQSAWPTMGVRPRRMLLNVLLSSLRPMTVRAGRFLPMHLQTYILIIKTSFSYYTLLVKVNETE